MTLFCDPRLQISHSGTDKTTPWSTLHCSNCVSMSKSYLILVFKVLQV